MSARGPAQGGPPINARCCLLCVVTVLSRGYVGRVQGEGSRATASHVPSLPASKENDPACPIQSCNRDLDTDAAICQLG